MEVADSYFTDEVAISTNSDHHGFMSIIGFNSSNAAIISDGPIVYECVGCETTTYCRPGCEGKTYAYEIDVVGPPVQNNGLPQNGGYGNLLVGSTTKPDGSPYYEYFSFSEFQTKTIPQNPIISDHYGFLSSQLIQIGYGYNYNPANSDNVIRIPSSSIPPSIIYKNKNGIPIQGDVYGIKKAKGIWNNYQFMESQIFTSGQSFCNLGFNQALAQINIDKSNWDWNTAAPWSEATHIQQTPGITVRPDLSCDGNNWNVFGQSNPTNPIGVEPTISEPCKWVINYTTSTSTIYDANGNIIWVINNGIVFMSADCILSGTVVDPNSPWIDWPNLYEYLTLSPTDPSDINGPIILNKNNNSVTYAKTGIPVLVKDFKLGLYHALFQFPDMTYISRYLEFVEDDNTPDLMANHLTTSANPVPVTNDVFVLNLETDVDLVFTYKLVTNTGSPLFEKEYNIRATESVRDYITIEGYNDPGMLINQFIFQDGSAKSFSITKL